MRFALLVPHDLATTVIVTLAMFQALALDRRLSRASVAAHSAAS